MQSGCVGRAMRNNQVGLEGDEFSRDSEPGVRVGAGRHPANVKLNNATLYPPELRESLHECGDEELSFPVALRISHQHADAPHSYRLLRARRQRPRRRRAAKKRDEHLASFHCPSSSRASEIKITYLGMLRCGI